MERFRTAVIEALGNRSPITVAKASGIERHAIRRVVEGRNPSLARAAEIADALDLDFCIGPASAVASSSARRRVLDEIDGARRRVDQILRSRPDD